MEPVKNYTIGIFGITISLIDITTVAQTIAAVCGAILVVIQLYKQLRK